MCIKRWLPSLLLLIFLVSCAQASPATPTALAPAATAVPTQTPAPTVTITAQSLSELGPYTVGARDMTFVDETRQAQEIIITLWYPTTEVGQDAAPDMSGAPYPVVIYSHGGYYDGLSHRYAHAGLAWHLASHGFVVVGLEHNDVDQAEIFVDRPLDILFVISQLDGLAENEWAGVLDMEKLGVMGMSQGTATTLQMGGARLDMEYYDAWCVAHPGNILCPPDPSIPERGRALMAEVGVVDENGLGYIPTDPRIHAVAAMGPGFAPMFGERGLKDVTAPVLLMAGTNADYYEEEVVGIYYPYLEEAEFYPISFIGYAHGDFFLPNSRRDQLMTAFFGYYLQDRQEYAQFLTEAYVNSVPGLAWGVYHPD